MPGSALSWPLAYMKDACWHTAPEGSGHGRATNLYLQRQLSDPVLSYLQVEADRIYTYRRGAELDSSASCCRSGIQHSMAAAWHPGGTPCRAQACHQPDSSRAERGLLCDGLRR